MAYLAANGVVLERWPCPVCSFDNAASHLRCHVCDTLRPHPRAAAAARDEQLARSRPFNVFAYDSGSLFQLVANILGGGVLGGLWSACVALVSRGRIRPGVLNMASLGVLVGASLTELRRVNGELWTVQDPRSGEIRRVPREMVSDGAATYQEIFGVEESMVQIMAALPTRKLRSKKDINEIPEHSKVCCICMDGYKHGDDVKQMPCKHVFHRPCIERWLVRAAVCPLCNYSLLAR